MSGFVNLIIQDHSGNIINSYIPSRDIPSMIINKKLNSDNINIRNERCEELRKIILNNLDKSQKNLMIPYDYGICFISFKQNIIANYQQGSSIVEILKPSKKDMKDSYKNQAQEYFNFKENEDGMNIITYNKPWKVYDSEGVESSEVKHVKALMMSAGIKFSDQEEQEWNDYLVELDESFSDE